MAAQVEVVWGRDGLGIWGYQMQTIMCIMDRQQGPTVQYSEIYLIFLDKPQWKRILKRMYVYI